MGMESSNASAANQQPDICCSDSGITCDSSSSVIEIAWDSRGLKGVVSEKLQTLTNLKKLNLSSNEYSGNFPSFLPKTSITHL